MFAERNLRRSSRSQPSDWLEGSSLAVIGAVAVMAETLRAAAIAEGRPLSAWSRDNALVGFEGLLSQSGPDSGSDAHSGASVARDPQTADILGTPAAAVPTASHASTPAPLPADVAPSDEVVILEPVVEAAPVPTAHLEPETPAVSATGTVDDDSDSVGAAAITIVPIGSSTARTIIDTLTDAAAAPVQMFGGVAAAVPPVAHAATAAIHQTTGTVTNLVASAGGAIDGLVGALLPPLAVGELVSPPSHNEGALAALAPVSEAVGTTLDTVGLVVGGLTSAIPLGSGNPVLPDFLLDDAFALDEIALPVLGDAPADLAELALATSGAADLVPAIGTLDPLALLSLHGAETPLLELATVLPASTEALGVQSLDSVASLPTDDLLDLSLAGLLREEPQHHGLFG